MSNAVSILVLVTKCALRYVTSVKLGGLSSNLFVALLLGGLCKLIGTSVKTATVILYLL